MKRLAAKILFPVLLVLLITMPLPASAAGFSLSPAKVEFDVPAQGSAVQKFVIYNFSGELEVSLKDIPLRVEPKTVPVNAGKEGAIIELTFYGDESLDGQDFEGQIRFRGKISSSVNIGYIVKAKVHQIASTQPPSQAQAQQPVAPSEKQSSSVNSWRAPVVIAVVAIVVGLLAAVVIILAIRRRRYC